MSDKVCVVVGTGPGVGLAVARRFGREGFRLALLARRTEALAGYTADLETKGVEASGFPADVADFGSLTTTLTEVTARMGTPAVLIYNPAVIRQRNPSALEAETLLADFRVNVAGALVCARQVIPAMTAAGRGTILFTGGGLALNPNPQYASLALGKAALRNLAYSLGAELEGAGIHVATVTIAGFVQPGTFFDPDLIAEKYWALHMQEAGHWDREVVYTQA